MYVLGIILFVSFVCLILRIRFIYSQDEKARLFCYFYCIGSLLGIMVYFILLRFQGLKSLL